jgi:hypothetical protein
MQTSSKETFTLNSTMTDLLCSTLVFEFLYAYIYMILYLHGAAIQSGTIFCV